MSRTITADKALTSRRPRGRLLGKRTAWIATGVVLVLVVVRAMLPIWIQRYVNERLDRIPEYRGRIGDVDLELWRGAYSVKDVRLVKTTGKVPVPLFSSPRVDFSMEWRALFEGKLVGEVEFDQPKINFVNGSYSEDSQTSVDDEWLSAIKDLFPFRINTFIIREGQIHYRDFQREPKVDVSLSRVHLVGHDFSNTGSPTKGKAARIEASGTLEEHARVTANARVSPAAREPTFTVQASIRALELKTLNDFLRAYARVDAEGGVMSIDTGIDVEENKFKGYVKPIVKGLKIFSLQNDSRNPLHALWEGIVGTVAEIFENQRHDQIGTEVPLAGTFDNPAIGTWRTLLGVFRNAFIEALKPGPDNAALSGEQDSKKG